MMPAPRPKSLPSRCTRCHDADGSGRSSRDRLGEIPDFNNHKWQASRTDAALLVSILDGKGSHMPSYQGKIGDDEARALVASVRAFNPEPAARRAGRRPGRLRAPLPRAARGVGRPEKAIPRTVRPAAQAVTRFPAHGRASAALIFRSISCTAAAESSPRRL